ncbi:GIY-YIG nuclease family protein [Myxococcota bacterium]|nr:GIY-YIG nuclease family protein [Myxococcota bacterium]
MHFVYLLKSLKEPKQRYIGLTEDVSKRLEAHNYGQSRHTSKYKPWEIVTVIEFKDKKKAADFETYLKSGSGRAFANRRLW